ncbi:hypothetical protein GO003_002750 [Methylicorpusculum oleiharenae]|uniref:hypothetical protein n=1 Tax=Methylicorpusculum oleiharenae TaxID=1338687 RepID=UPI00135931CC|nr:hypothetical protein [Methylicorpusculum oleiharenae]MCD2449307.1 hypothetical protein [Methylicorpusculum oleiharenae]
MSTPPFLDDASVIFNEALKRPSADKPRKRGRPATHNIDDKTLNHLAYSLGWLFINPASISASESALLHYGGKWPLKLSLLGCPEYLIGLYLRDATFADKHLWSPEDWQNYARYLEERAQESHKIRMQLEQKLYWKKKKASRGKKISTEGKSPATSLLGALYQNPKTKPKRGRPTDIKKASILNSYLKELHGYILNADTKTTFKQAIKAIKPPAPLAGLSSKRLQTLLSEFRRPAPKNPPAG